MKILMQFTTERELQLKYPKCFGRLQPELMVESVVFPENRISIYEWLTKIYNYE